MVRPSVSSALQGVPAGIQVPMIQLDSALSSFCCLPILLKHKRCAFQGRLCLLLLGNIDNHRRRLLKGYILLMMMEAELRLCKHVFQAFLVSYHPIL